MLHISGAMFVLHLHMCDFFFKLDAARPCRLFPVFFLFYVTFYPLSPLWQVAELALFFFRLNNIQWHTSTHTYAISNGKHTHIFYIHRCIYTHAYVSCIHWYIHTPLYVMRYNSLSSHPLTPKLILCLVHNMVAVQWGADVF